MLLLVTCLLIFGPSVAFTQTVCTAGNVRGICMSTSSCSGKSVAGLCPGPANIQCCIPKSTSCLVNRRNGICMSTSSCTGTSVSGYCAGPANIQCCITNSDSSRSTNELCGSYVDSSINYIKGNGNVAYPVLKIRPEHLTEPGIYSSAPTAQDNTMTTTTACAFDRMASAAKKSDITITINSGFRTITRQEYFWNCYKTKSCNNGNLAARPGTSNHGRGIALDLNTNCGRQTGAQPNCNGSKVYQWLKNNAHKHGFKRTVQSEPWHWEYVGANTSPASFT